MTDKRLISEIGTASTKRNEFLYAFLPSGIFAVIVVLNGAPLWLAILFLCFGIVFGIYFKARVQLLVDEVYDCGNFLLVRNEGQELEYPLTQIVSIVRFSALATSQIIRLKMKDGAKIYFLMSGTQLFSAQNKDLWGRILGKNKLYRLWLGF